MVGPGLLGEVPTLELACPDPNDAQALQAYLAAVGLGVEGAAERGRLAKAADRAAGHRARAVSSAGRRRGESGARLSTVD